MTDALLGIELGVASHARHRVGGRASLTATAGDGRGLSIHLESGQHTARERYLPVSSAVWRTSPHSNI
ncbi:hypothetical protein [Streptomyces niveus]|uniref:hypothetical protein n=1 Tax=Streptomyces niveus TaxID=193462 RepID=UPI0034212205